MVVQINDIHEMVANVELRTIVVHEERARLVHWTDEELSSKSFPESDSSFALLSRSPDYQFRFRLRFTDDSAEYIADFAAVYEVVDSDQVSEEVLTDFAQRVAFMAVYPYLRASVFNSAARLGQAIPVLGIVRQGEFGPQETMTPEMVAAEFGDNRSEIAE